MCVQAVDEAARGAVASLLAQPAVLTTLQVCSKFARPAPHAFHMDQHASELQIILGDETGHICTASSVFVTWGIRAIPFLIASLNPDLGCAMAHACSCQTSVSITSGRCCICRPSMLTPTCCCRPSPPRAAMPQWTSRRRWSSSLCPRRCRAPRACRWWTTGTACVCATQNPKPKT